MKSCPWCDKPVEEYGPEENRGWKCMDCGVTRGRVKTGTRANKESRWRFIPDGTLLVRREEAIEPGKEP